MYTKVVAQLANEEGHHDAKTLTFDFFQVQR